jgi:hypothetical protein
MPKRVFCAVCFSMPIYAPVFEVLQRADIPFVVIGGHAVILHGYRLGY